MSDIRSDKYKMDLVKYNDYDEDFVAPRVLKVKEINKRVVKKIPKIKVDERPVKGADMCVDCYSNIFCLAPTACGKTTCVFCMIKAFVGKKTKIVAFVSTIWNDENWEVIRKWCDEKEIEFTGYTSLREDGKDILQYYLNKFKQEAEEREKAKNKEALEPPADLMFDEEGEEIPKPRKSKYQYPDYIFIIDDCADEIRMPSYATLLKKARHYNIKTITSSQDLKDLLPAARNQIRVWLLFGGIPEERLENIYHNLSLKMPFELFRFMYRHATKEKYNFLYMAQRDGDFRHNFNKRFIIPDKYK